MANVDTLPEMLRPLMEGPSIETPRCAVCGAPWPLNRLCGSGNGSGCHGLAHANRLHFRWVRAEQRFNRPAPPGSGHWEYLLLPKPTKYADALAMDGWRRLPRGRRCM